MTRASAIGRMRGMLDRLPPGARGAVIAVYRAFQRWFGGPAAARRQRAHALWRAGAFEAALAELRAAIAASPREAGLRESLVNFHFELGQPDKALAAARLWLAGMPGHPRAHFHIGRLLASSPRDEGAATHLERAQADPSLTLEAGLALVQVKLHLKDPRRAVNELHRLLARPESIDARHAEMILSLTQPLAALRQFRAVADCCEAIRHVDEGDPLRLATHAAALRELGLGREAETMLEGWRAGRVRSSDRARMIRAYGALGRLDEAADMAREWAAAEPGSAVANWHAANLLTRLGRHREAREHVEKAIVDPAAPLDSGFDIVRMLILDNEVEQAAALMEKLLEFANRIGRHNAGPITALARTFHARRRYRLAEACCRAIEAFRDDSAFLALHGNILLSMSRVGHARERLERSLFMSPRSELAPWLLLALSHFHEGNPELGRAYLAEAVGTEEEGKTLARIFGAAAPLIQPFGSEIDATFGTREAA